MVESDNVCNGIDLTENKDGGVIKVIKREGSKNATPTEGATVFVHYVGTLEDGTQFDTSRDKKPFDFVLGKGQVISGLEVGVETMKKGEISTLTCKPEYAYGKPGKPPTIPQDSTLVFEVELLDWEDEKVTLDSLVSKKILKKGKGTDSASDGGIVEVHLIGKVGDDRVFDERDVKFTVGEGGEADVIPGVDAALKTMKKDEISLVNCDSSYAFGDKGREDWGIEPNTPVEYEVHLKSFEQLKQPWELSSVERVDGAKLVKEKGTEYFKQQKFSLALGKFTRMVSLVESLSEEADLKQAHVSSLILAGHLNVALCYLKLGKYMECIESCDKALCRDKNNVKAIYRKGRAKLAMYYPDEAIELFRRVIKLDPTNKDARTYYNITKKEIAEYRVKEKKIYANMFEKFAASDARNAAQSENTLNKDGKDVFTRAEEEAKETFGEEAVTESPDLEKNCSSEIKEDTSKAGNDQGDDKTPENLTNGTKNTNDETAPGQTETPSG